METKKGTGWIQKLNKEQIIDELKKRNIACEETENFNILREKLRAAIKEAATKEEAEFDPSESVKERDSSESEAVSDADSNMSGDSVKIQFQLGRDDWETFVEQLEFYIVEKNIQDDKKKVSTLVTRVDQETFKLIKQLMSPDKIIDKTFEQVVKVMNAHFKPKPSEVMERCKFHLARQEASESITDYVAKLKKLALHCNFDKLNIALRDQLVCGIKDKDIRVKLFAVEDLDYDKAVEIATTHEAAVKNAAESLDALDNKPHKVEIYQLRRNNQSAQRKSEAGNSRQNQCVNKRHETGSMSSTSKRSITCYCCGKENHTKEECRLRD